MQSHSHSSNSKKPKYANRSRARVVVFQILFQEDINPGSALEFAEKYFEEELPKHEQIVDFARSLLKKVREHREQIDAQIGELSHNWSVSRMSTTDRNILRLAVCEMRFHDTPKPVIINEAVELAKQFGNKESPAFINGILDKITN